MKKILAVTMALASMGALAQTAESSLLPSTSVITGVVAVSAPMVLLAVAAAGVEENLDTGTPQTMPSTSTSTVGR